MKPLFSIVIPYHNSADTIGPLLDSIYHSKHAPTTEIIIADDASENRFQITKIPYATINRIPVRTVSLRVNKGPAIARNRGAALATGKYLVFLDSDVRLFPDALHNLWKIYVNDPDIRVVTGVWSKKQQTTKFFPNFKALRDWSYWNAERERDGYYYLFSTRIAAIEREVFLRLGGFNGAFKQMEDVEMTYKIAKRYAIIFASNVCVHHEFEDFWPIAKKYFLRAYYWAILFQERKKFDPVATTWKEAVSAISGMGIVATFVCFMMSLFISLATLHILLGTLFCFLVLLHLYFVRKFLWFVYQEKGSTFALQSFFMGLILYCFITAGAFWSKILPRKR